MEPSSDLGAVHIVTGDLPTKESASLPDDQKLEVYLDASGNVRHYGNLRFAQLTLFSAVSGALLGAIFLGGVSDGATVALSVVGIAVSLAIWIMEERVSLMFHHYRLTAIRLEAQMGFEQHANRPEGDLVGTAITAANAVRLVFVSSIVGWVLLIVSHS